MFLSLLQRLTHRQWVLVAAGVCFLAAPAAFAGTNLSVWVFPGASGRLLSVGDALGNRIVDTSSAGYKSGLVPLPLSNSVPVRTNLSPVAGDNVARIQSAINYVQSLPLDANGFRGAVLLNAGEYALSNSINITASGVVLRGVGSGSSTNNNTVLRATATNQYTLVKITGTSSATDVSGTTHTITNRYVPVGARSFEVDSTIGLAVGNYVLVRRVATTAWIHDLGMDLLGPAPVVPWTASSYNIDLDRVITRIEGNRIFIDAPVTCAIDAGYANGTIRKVTRSGRLTNSGIEHLRGVSDYDAGVTDDENHASTFISCNGLENGWVRNVISEHFVYSCVTLSACKFVTVADSQCLDPISQITGGRRYAFNLSGSAVSCLIANCYTRKDRHQFVTGSRIDGPNVFVDSVSDTAYSDAGPHHRWATGNLWDNITVNGNTLDIQNRGNLGTGHGWSGANCVAYNCDADGGYVVQNPPGARNWLIGSLGTIKNGTVYVGPHDPGTYDSSGTNVFPNSLYYAQLQDRLAAPNLVTREYWLGEISRFTNTPEAVPLDAAWSNAVKVVSGGKTLNGFDSVVANQWVPFTFNYSLAANDRIVGASLMIAMRSATGATNNPTIYLGATNNAFTFSSLGWLPIAGGTNTTVRVLDLMSQTNRLTNGLFNVAVASGVGIDWALLQLDVAPVIIGGDVTTLTPVADATVQGGTSTNLNFGTNTTLTVKEDTGSDFDRKAFLRWDLTNVVGTVYSAKIRLTPVSVGTNGIETGVTVSTNDTWTEAGITWNNQPAVGKRFVTWIPATNAPVEFMVTPQVLDALNGDKKLSVQLYSLRNVGASGIVTFGSREATNASTRPQLLLLTASPPTISNLTNRTVAVNTNTGPLAFTVSDPETAASNLVVSAESSNTNLVPVANLVFGGSGASRTLTVTPAVNQAGTAVITVTVTDAAGLTASDSFTLTVATHPPGVFIWNGPGAGANNWSLGGNWIPTGPPESFDDVKFFDPGASGVAISNVNSVVDAGFATGIASLHIGNTNGNHTIRIADGQSLDISGANDFIVGTEKDNGSAQVVFATITGAGGALNLNSSSADLIVRQGSANNSSQRATLDLSGLGYFNATLGRLLVGTFGPVNRPTGTLLLARTNNLTFTGSSPAIDAADSGSNNGNESFIYLGIENQIEADTITIGRSKSSATLAFNPAFTNFYPTLFLRGATGSRVDTLAVGDNSPQGVSSLPSSGVMNFSGGTVDAEVDVFFVGKGQTSNGAGTATGTLTLTDGLLDVNTLEVGYQNATNAAAVVTGTVNVNGTAVLSVNTLLRLARYTGTGTLPVGALNLGGGSVTVDGDIVAGGGTSSIAVSGGALAVTGRIGTPAAPVGKMALTNATLQFPVTIGVTNVVVTSLTTGGSSNVITVTSLPAAAVPAQLPLLNYAGSIGGAGFNFVLGGAVPGYGSYLSDNVANSSVDLVFVSLPATPPGFTAVTLNGNNLIFTGTNGIPNWPYYVLASTNLALPLEQWPRVTTNSFDGAGNFTFTNALDAPAKFYRLQLPGT